MLWLLGAQFFNLFSGFFVRVSVTGMAFFWVPLLRAHPCSAVVVTTRIYLQYIILAEQWFEMVLWI